MKALKSTCRLQIHSLARLFAKTPAFAAVVVSLPLPIQRELAQGQTY